SASRAARNSSKVCFIVWRSSRRWCGSNGRRTAPPNSLSRSSTSRQFPHCGQHLRAVPYICPRPSPEPALGLGGGGDRHNPSDGGEHVEHHRIDGAEQPTPGLTRRQPCSVILCTGTVRGADMDGKWLTYADAAVRLGVTPEAARRRAIRGKWARMPGNDGRTLVGVPDELHAPRTPDVRPDASVLLHAHEDHIA